MKSLVGLLAACLLALGGSVHAQDFPTQLPEPDADGFIDIPGFGSINVNDPMSRDVELPTDGDPPFQQAPDPLGVVNEGLTIGEFDLEMLARLYQQDPGKVGEILNALDPGPPNEVPPDTTYNIIIESVDSTEFPRVSVRFKIFPRDVDTPPFDHTTYNVAVQEALVENGVITDEQAALWRGRPPPIEVCDVKPTAIALAIDTSCSVTRYLRDARDGTPGMLTNAANFFRDLPGFATTLPDNNPPVENSASLFGFDGRGKVRWPPGSGYTVISPASSQQFATDAAGIDVGSPCLGSPIYNSMTEELRRLASYQADNPDLVRGLVTFADFKDTEPDRERQELIAEAQKHDVTIVNLGFGRVRLNGRKGVIETSQAAGGTFMQGASGNVTKALEMTFSGLAVTYCLQYDSPHPDDVNTPAEVTISAGSRAGKARFPLPFVIPEDTPGVEMIFPLTTLQYDKLTADGGPPPTEVTFAYRDYDENADEFVDVDDPGDGAERDLGQDYSLTVPVDPSTWFIDRGDPDDPLDDEAYFKVNGLADQARFDSLFTVPTEYVDISGGGNAGQLIERVKHFQARVRFNPASPTATKPYPSNPRVSIQDRTPPHVFLRVAPQDGAPPFEVRMLEDGFNVDPQILDPGDLANPPALAQASPGQKRHFARFSARTSEGAPFDGVTRGVQVFPESDDPAAHPVQSLDLDTRAPFNDTIYVAEKSRAQVLVLARDNYATLEEGVPDAQTREQAFDTEPPGDLDDFGPAHARFPPEGPDADLNALQAPYLPKRTLEEMRNDRRLAGVTWWLESEDPNDRFAGPLGVLPPRYEHLEEFVYPVNDEIVEDELVSSGVTLTGSDLRSLHVYAQDGAGNVTYLVWPIFVAPADFAARSIQFTSQKR